MTRKPSIGTRISLALANGLGLGLIPIASGTFGTLLAIPLVWCCWEWLEFGVGLQIVLSVALALIAIPVCGIAENQYATKDDGRIVADEYMTFPICMIGLPWHPALLLVAFFSCRFFDIAKPFPANRLQRMKGGVGIVIDDVVAALYSLAFNHAVFWFLWRRVVESV